MDVQQKRPDGDDTVESTASLNRAKLAQTRPSLMRILVKLNRMTIHPDSQAQLTITLMLLLPNTVYEFSRHETSQWLPMFILTLTLRYVRSATVTRE